MKKLIIILLLIGTSCSPTLFDYQNSIHNLKQQFPHGKFFYDPAQFPNEIFIYDSISDKSYRATHTTRRYGAAQVKLMNQIK
jgi:hypothetical protein